jgi:16S rRNA (cytosine967-C5)-methyltransferase
VNESVSLAHHARLRSAGALVNAVLRRAASDLEVDPVADIDDPIERLAVATSHPLWLIEKWIKAFGEEETQAFCRANNQPAPIAFRVVRQRAAETEVIAKLRNSGADITPSKVAQHAWRLHGNRQAFAALVGSGEVYIQDEASQMVPDVLHASPGERVLDLCAAPGSKTTQIADRMAGSGTVIASDLHPHRLRVVAESARLHNLPNVHCLLLDGLRPLPLKNDIFDRVLVDAPCSGTGTLRRNPEIRWRISAHDIEDLSARQQQLLGNASRVVKPGGKLVYSTCSVEPEENELVAQTFLENNSNFSLVELPPAGFASMPGTIRTWPQHQDTDGFFVAAFERRH